MSAAAPVHSTTSDQSALVQTLSDEVAALKLDNEQLKRQLDWFKKQLFGSKSEQRLLENPDQPLLTGLTGDPVPRLPAQEKQKISYERGKANKKRHEDCVTDSGLRFSADVPVTIIDVEPSELKGPDAGQYEIIGYKTTHRLAQHQCSHEVLCYRRPVLKRRDETGSDKLVTTPAPANVLDNSLADVSFLAGMLVDKFNYHLPLYRQHQRVKDGGIDLSRATLTNLTQRSIELLRSIADAQLAHILTSQVLSMDETPIKAGRTKNNRKKKGQMKQAWFWPLMGDQDEIAFTYSPSRGRQHIESVLRSQFSGTLISDGYTAYSSYIKANEAITHANCWVHGRRKFLEAEDSEPEAVAQVLDTIGHLYQVEERIREQNLTGEKKRDFRLHYSKPVVEQLFAWLDKQRQRPELLPSNPFSKAIAYMQNRETELKVFLEDPAVPMDNNHTERALRAIPMGRKSWLFCWTEIGAEHVGIIQSLLVTCRLQNINPYDYLVDVLQRISIHPASRIEELTPREWKTRFADNPMRSDLYDFRHCRDN
jgi:transposase